MTKTTHAHVGKRADSTRTSEARERTMTRREARYIKRYAPAPFNADALARELATTVEGAR